MALDGTYTGLQASIANFLHRADLTAKIPDHIALAEGEMNRGITARRQIARATDTVSSEYLALPTDFSGVRTFRLTSGTKPHLTFVGPESMADLKDNESLTGQPSQYTVVGSEFEFWPVPDGDYTCQISYLQSIPPLASNSTNWVLTQYPDVYLNGALKWAFVDLRDDQRAAAMDALFQRSMNDVNTQSNMESVGGAIRAGASGMVV